MTKRLDSELAFDLALSKVTTAALCSIEDLDVESDARTQAEYLYEVLTTYLRDLSFDSQISAEDVPDQLMREQLEHLATMPAMRKASLPADQALLEQVTPMLQQFSQSRLKKTDTKKLLDSLLILSKTDRHWTIAK